MENQDKSNAQTASKKWYWLALAVITITGFVWAFNERGKNQIIQKASVAEQKIEEISEIPVEISTETPIVERPSVIMKTNQGEIELELYRELAPLAVENFLRLSQTDFYNGVKFHRVIRDFMIQSGDPNSADDNWEDDGLGGPGYTFVDEFNDAPLTRGSLAMANAGPDTNGSQFFIVTAEATPWLDGKHTNFGRVVRGYEVVAAIENVSINAQAHPTEDVVILEIVIK